ncbi:MAG: hypothetical protein IJP17_00150 [Clostridia bacterium]|nr:hypothetical protein [Clostridia bacterium]
MELSGQMLEQPNSPFEPRLLDLCIMVFAVGFLYHITRRASLMRGVSPATMSSPYPRTNPNARRAPQQRGIPQNQGYSGQPRAGRPASPYPANPYYNNPQGYVQQRQPMQRANPYVAQQRPMPPVFIPQPLYQQQPQMMQQPYMPGGGADMYTTRGAGMRVTNDFTLRPFYDTPNKYGGLGDFRDDMVTGQRALEILGSSDTPSRFGAADIAESTPTAELISEQNKQLSAMTEEVNRSLSSLIAEKDNALNAPKVVTIDDGTTEPTDSVRETPPAPPRSISLGSGRRGSKLSDHLNEVRERRAEEAERARSHMTEREFDPYADGYGDVYFEDRYARRPAYIPAYEDEDEYEDVEYGSGDYDYEYDDGEYIDDYESGGYDTDYYADDYYDDDEYDDEYDEYDDEYVDEYDDYDDYDDGYEEY